MSAPRDRSKKALFNEKLNALISEFGQDMLANEIEKKGIIKKEVKKEPLKSIPTFEEAENLFFTSPISYFANKKKETQRGYVSEINSFKGFIQKELKLGTKALITDVFENKLLLKYLNKFQNSGTRKKKATFLRAFLKSVALDFLDKKQIDFLLTDTLHIKDKVSNLPKALTTKQIDYVLEAVKETISALRNYTIIWTLLGSGIRINEMVNLQIKDIDWEEKAVYIIPKGESEKDKRYMTDVSFDVLTTYLHFRYSDKKDRLTKSKYNDLYIFSVHGNSPLAKSSVREMLNLIKKRGIKEKIFTDEVALTPHVFRHCFSMYAYQSGMDIFKISKLLGHKDIETTQIYLRLFPSQLRDELNTKYRYANVELEYLKQKENLYGKFGV